MEDLPRERMRLTRHEIDLLLRRERGAKLKVAALADVATSHVARWFRDNNWHHNRIAEIAETYAMDLAARERLSRDEVYVDKPAERIAPGSDCATMRASLLA